MCSSESLTEAIKEIRNPSEHTSWTLQDEFRNDRKMNSKKWSRQQLTPSIKTFTQNVLWKKGYEAHW